MKGVSLYRVELRRLALSKVFWGIAVLCLCAPLLGYSVYTPCVYSGNIMSCIYIANPVLAGTTVGAVLWAVFVIFETSRLHRSGTNVLTDAVASPVSLSAARISAMLTLSVVVAIICSLLYLPFTAVKMEYLFMADFYFKNFLVFMLPTWWISILFAEAFYLLTYKIELAVILYTVTAYFSFSRFAEDDYFMRWINPRVAAYSDGFVSLWFLRIGAYSRMIWLCIALGIWLLSLLCIRKYHKNLIFSFARGLKKVYIPILAGVTILIGTFMRQSQPFVDHGSKDPDIYYSTAVTYAPDAENTSSTHFSVTAMPATGEIHATAQYRLLKPYHGESVLQLNSGYKITGITYGDQDISFRTEINKINGLRLVYFTLPDIYGQKLVIEYEGIPSTANCSSGFQIKYSVDENYITLGGQALFPWIESYAQIGDATMDITIPDNLTPFLNYNRMNQFVDNGDGTKTWTSSCSTYTMNFTAGHYMIDKIYADNLAIDFAYGEAYQTAVNDYDVKTAIADVFNYCGKHYGVLSFSDNQRLLLLQISSMYGGGSAYNGMVQWFENVLAPDTLSDPARGANATDVFIHEMVHNWWGDLGLICEPEDIWTAEGLTVYSTYRIIKEKYGALYAQTYYVDEWQKAVEEQNRDFYNRHPEYFAQLPEKYQAQLNAKNNSINWYRRMPLMILKAESLVGGEEKMDEILSRMYADRQQYSMTYSNTGFTYQDFLDYCGLTEEDLRLE